MTDDTDLWVQVLDLAWTSFRAGTTPVGALVIDADGAVVATGRGRRYEAAVEDRQLAHSHIAHAEVNALALLPPNRHYDDHVLLTSLEPCCMCVGAAVQSTFRSVRYAARDPYAGASTMVIDTPQSRRRPLHVDGPEPGLVGTLSEVLHVRWLADSHPGPPLEAQRGLGASYELALDPRTSATLTSLAADAAAIRDVMVTCARMWGLPSPAA